MATVPALSQERLAQLTGLHRSGIGKIEQGKVEPQLTTLVVLAHGLGAKLDDLVADLGIPSAAQTSAGGTVVIAGRAGGHDRIRYPSSTAPDISCMVKRIASAMDDVRCFGHVSHG